jgi:hypothetical protein
MPLGAPEDDPRINAGMRDWALGIANVHIETCTAAAIVDGHCCRRGYGDGERAARIWDCEHGNEVRSHTGHIGRIHGVVTRTDVSKVAATICKLY